MRRAILFGWSVLTLVFLLGSVEAFDDNAHRLLSAGAVDASNLDSFLKGNLQEFLNGTGQIIEGRRVLALVQDGSVNEDAPFPRVQEHFHNPTLPWNQAGLSTGGISSVIWSQTANQDDGVGGGNHSWQDARVFPFRAEAFNDEGHKLLSGLVH